MRKIPLVIAGPTASGKTDLALALAKSCGGQIISADSRQVYKLLSVGTAAPAGAWQNGDYIVEGVPYRLVDFLDVDKRFDASRFALCARDFFTRAQNAAPPMPTVFCGGTGMYLQGYFCGFDKLPAADEDLRRRLHALALERGKEHLHNLLKQKDAEAAAQIPPANLHRVMRALEICLLSGKKASSLRTGKFHSGLPSHKARYIYLNWDKELLNRRIIERSELIFPSMEKEIKKVLSLGYKEDCAGLKSLGYREVLAYLKGDMTKKEALERLIISTRQYAKRQRTWFSRYKNMTVIDVKAVRDFDARKLASYLEDIWDSSL